MTFYSWLMRNRHREDPVGDLARDVRRDENWPRKAITWSRIKRALPSSACDGARRALLRAWKEYRLYEPHHD